MPAEGTPSLASRAVIVGFGLMGCDIASIFLAGGWRVTAVEPDLANWSVRRERVRQALSQLDVTPDDTHLDLAATLEEVSFQDAALVIEAAPERLDVKRAIFAQLDAAVPNGIPIASNASGFRITDIAGDLPTCARMANLHFFLPAHLVPGVEVVRGEHTDPTTCDRLATIMASLGRKPIRVARDVPGFLANRIQHALMREVFAVIDAGLASAADVDDAVRYAFGFRYLAAGPITQKELAGLDSQLAAAATIYPSLSNTSVPSPTLSRLVAEGRLGVKTGRGFEEWPPERAAAEQERYERLLLAAVRLLRLEASAAPSDAGPP
ncbi:3-hydroxyacyl-CoA dehydrogenase family protein [Roseomonas sp. GCM10028921]